MLHHDVANVSPLHTAQEEQLTIRCFTLHNSVIPDDTFKSPARNYEHMASWLFSPNDGTISPVSSNSSSIGCFSGNNEQPPHPGSPMIHGCNLFFANLYHHPSGQFLHFLPLWTSLKNAGDCRSPYSAARR